MKLPIPIQIVERLSDAVAVMDRDGVVAYANNAFQKLYNPAANPSRTKPCQELLELNFRFFESGKTFASERVMVPPIGKKFEVFVYSLNSLGISENLNIVLVRTDGHRMATEFTMVDKLVNSFINEQRILSESLDREFAGLKGDDSAFKLALINAQKAAKTELPVLILGESGTGKEVVARSIHSASRRKEMNFIDINCAAIPDSLIESEMFGYERGAFTGARREGKAGLFEQAHQGSIFMDEIGDASPQTQSKVLRVLQEGQFKRVGASRNIRVDVRLISATNRELTHLISEGRFREDLFYRINTLTINLPPLRERQADIRLLADHFLKEYAQLEGRELSFSPDSMELMESYEWPGNVRELRGVVDYAATMATGSLLTPDLMPSFLYDRDRSSAKKNKQSEFPYCLTTDRKSLLSSVLQQVEKDLIKKVLERSKTKTEAIRVLGISRRTFYAKIKEYGLS